MIRTFLPLAALAASASIAAADRTPAQQAGDDLVAYRDAVGSLERDPFGKTKLALDGCKQVIDKAHAAGVTDDTKIPVYTNKSFTLGEAPALCSRFARAVLISQAAGVMYDAAGTLQWCADIDIASNHEENQAKLVETAERCDTELTRLLAAGVDADFVVTLGRDSQKIRIADGKTKLCAPLAKIAATFAKDVEAERKARYERAAKPYKAVGIKGDKLEFIIDNEDSIRGIGGRALGTPKELKAAKVMFVGTYQDVGGKEIWHVTRYVFSGDRLVSSTMETYRGRPGARTYR